MTVFFRQNCVSSIAFCCIGWPCFFIWFYRTRHSWQFLNRFITKQNTCQLLIVLSHFSHLSVFDLINQTAHFFLIAKFLILHNRQTSDVLSTSAHLHIHLCYFLLHIHLCYFLLHIDLCYFLLHIDLCYFLLICHSHTILISYSINIEIVVLRICNYQTVCKVVVFVECFNLTIHFWICLFSITIFVA